MTIQKDDSSIVPAIATGVYRNIRPEDLPVPEHQVMQLIRYILEEEAQIQELTRMVAFNPALTAQLLGVVNSAFFGFRRKINTISDALVALGMKRLKNLILCFAVKETLSAHEIPGLDLEEFWGDAIRRGVAAQQLGIMVNGPVEEAFSAGMLQDVGLLVLFAMAPDKADRWPLLRTNPPDLRRKMEFNLFRATHDDIGHMLTEKWHLPETYAAAIGSHHLAYTEKAILRPDAGDKFGLLTAIAHLADLCNAVFTCHDKAYVLADLEKKADLLFGLAQDSLHSLLTLLPAQTEETMAAMKIAPQSTAGFQEIMALAAQKLARDSISFQELAWKLQETLKERDEIAARLASEIATAREIQTGLLPDLTARKGVAAFNLPARQLSGDFYDYIVRKKDEVCFCLGDVSGKGTAAALLMSKTVSLFRWLCRSDMPLAAITEQLNEALCETAVRGMFVTLVAGVLNTTTRQFTLVNMGHPPPLLKGEQLRQIQATGPPLGIMPGIRVKAKTYGIQGSRLYLYSDGFTEGRLKDGKILGAKGFLTWVLKSSDLAPDAQADHLRNFCREQFSRLHDDVTLMILWDET